MQAHGGFGDYLDAYAVADIPESESLFAGGDYDFLKLADRWTCFRQKHYKLRIIYQTKYFYNN